MYMYIFIGHALCSPSLGESPSSEVGFASVLVLSLAFWSFHYCVPEVRVELVPFCPSGPPRLIRFLDLAIPSSLLREFPHHPSSVGDNEGCEGGM